MDDKELERFCELWWDSNFCDVCPHSNECDDYIARNGKTPLDTFVE